MLPMTAPGRIGLVAESFGYGRTVPPGVVNWLRLIGIRWRSPCDPKYPAIKPSPWSSRSTFTFHDCIRLGRKFGSVNVGATLVAAPAPPIALSSLTLLAAVP